MESILLFIAVMMAFIVALLAILCDSFASIKKSLKEISQKLT